MDIRHKHQQNKGMFFVEKQDEIVGELTYHDGKELTMVIDHTEVDEKMEGKGVGAKLVLAAVEYARKHHLLITPKCSFAQSVFLRKPELSDVLS